MELTLLAAVLTAGAAAYLALRLHPLDAPDRPLDRLLGAALAGVFVGRIAHLAEAGINPLTNPAQVLLIRGGVDPVWASVAAVATLAWPLRRQLPALDNFGPIALAALGGWHAGCLWRSTCLGVAADVPWAWPLPGSEIGRHPVELYTALLLGLGSWLMTRVRLPVGGPTGLAVGWAAASRLATQPLRPSLDGGPTVFYAVATALGAAVVVWALSRARSTA